MDSNKARVRRIVASTLICALAGCDEGGGNVRSAAETGARASLMESHSGRQQAILADLYDEGEWNAVLNLDRLGQAALREGDLDTAGRAFDAAIERIEAVYADNPAAKKARSNFSSEGTKDFKGEPYERGMTFVYRGFVDLALGDYENARAAFKSAEFQNTMSQQETYGNDFPLATWLAGWASHCEGDEEHAKEFYDTALGSARTHQTLVEQKFPALSSNRTLVVFERGLGPSKTGSGQYHEKLQFSSLGGDPDASLLITSAHAGPAVTGRGAEPQNLNSEDGDRYAESLNYLATTRGGRQVDAILNGKASFKSTAKDVGDASMQGGLTAVSEAQMLANQAAQTGNAQLANMSKNMAGLGGALAIVGLFSSMASDAAKPAADTRYWANLPASIRASDQPLPLDAAVKLAQHRNDVPKDTAIEPYLDHSVKACRLIMASDGMSDTAGSEATQHGYVKEDERRQVMNRNHARDTAFRTWLVATFTKSPVASTSVQGK